MNISLKTFLAKVHSTVRRLDEWRTDARFGIASRLGISFGAVAVLAVAANMLAVHGTLIVHTTKIQPVIEPSATLRTPVLPAAAGYTDLNLAIERFAAAVLIRIDDDSQKNGRQLRAAENALREQTTSYIVRAQDSIPRADLDKLKAQVKAQEERARELIRAADTRRDLLRKHQARFEMIDARMKGSLDSAWKVLGRIISRQSLVELSRNLDEMRWHLTRFAASSGYSETDAQKIAESESAFAATLQQNERSLARSQGVEWVKQMHDDLASLVSVRTAILAANGKHRRSSERFSKSNAELAASLRNKSARQAAGVSKALKDITAAPIQATASAAPRISTTTTTTSKSPDDRKSRLLIAGLSIGVLILLLAIAIGTVRSIVLPVRRLIHATSRLAKGEASARVARGGIKELDTLGVAFNEMAGQLAVAQRVTQEYQRELESKVDERTRELQQLAENDPLTLLPNRRQLFILLNAALADARKNGRYVGVFFLDLDNFKNINDSMGHAYGDRVLKEIAARLRETAGRHGFAARLGGDEFTVVYAEADGVEEISSAGWELVQAFQRPFTIDNRDLMVSVSVGASVYPDHEQDAAELLRAADAALFRAKALGRNQLAVFTPGLFEAAAAKFATEQGLRRAIQRGEFELVFQPEINVETLQTTLVEALLRWRLPDGKYIPPDEFLAVAEESGLIMDISDWVLRTAIETASRWHHGAWPEARVAINISARQLFDSRFAERVQGLLQEFDLPARCIEIELTETVMQTGPATIETLKVLRALGIAIALDDFGTGYSSLASLEQLPLTRVKLDRSLIASIDNSARSQAIARAIIALCHSLELEVTAEGVERPDQLSVLLQHPAICLQGYLLSRPVSEADLLQIVACMPGHMQSILLSNPIAPVKYTELAHRDPRSETLLQLADMCTGAIARR